MKKHIDNTIYFRYKEMGTKNYRVGFIDVLWDEKKSLKGGVEENESIK